MGLFLRVLLILLFLANVGCLLTGCQLQTHKRASFFRDGDILIGGDFVVHSEFTSSNPTYTDEPKPALCKGFHTRYYREVLAMVFAIEEINHAQELLPNITLGFRIFDSCMSEKRAIQSTFEILTGRNGVVPGYSCRRRHILAGLIGETMSSLTIPMADVLGIFRYPQISHSAVISTLSDKVRFPAFFRTVPGNTFQNVALARLIGHFGWTWVGMVISDDDVGIQGSQEIQKVNEENGVCVAFVEKVHLLYSMEKVLKVIKRIQQNSETVIVFHSAEMHLKVLLEMMYAQNVTDKVLIFSALFALTPGIYANQAWRILNGALGLVPHTGTMPGFEKFLYDLHPQTAPDDIFIKTFWEKAFLCKWSVPNNTEITQSKEEGRTLVPCSQEKSLDKLDKRLFELNDLSYTYNSYIAVYAFAHGLKALLSCRAGHGPFTHASCADANNIQPWQILHYLKNLHFGTGRGDEMFFDANGDALTSYDILNVQISDDEVFRLENVGTIDSQAPKGSDITLNRSSILWSDGLSQVPRSVCSVSCDPGYRKAAREGQPVCCFDCLPCSQGKISNETDLVNCRNCPLNQWPNEKRDKCLLKMTEFLSYEEPLGLALIVTAAIFTLFSAIVLWVITKNRNSPIVKANNRGLSYLLLVSLILCFLCAFIFIGSPTKLRCMLRQTAVFLVFTISVSSVLAKNIIVVIAFKAKIQNSIVKKFLSMKTPICVVAFPFLVQGLISVTWILKSPPFPERNMKLYNEKIIFECNEGERLFFYCMLGYMGLLATVSFIVAFLSRNLPGSFNEAKLITFSMLVFVSVWISFIPAYLSTRGKYMVAVEVFAILCSGAGLLGCIFFPKCYIILVKPDKNTRGYVARQLQFGGKGV